MDTSVKHFEVVRVYPALMVFDDYIKLSQDFNWSIQLIAYSCEYTKLPQGFQQGCPDSEVFA